MGWAACFLRDSTRTVDDSLPVHFLLADCGQKLRRDGVLPVLTVAHLLLQRRGVRQQRQRRVYAPAEIKTRGDLFNKHSCFKNVLWMISLVEKSPCVHLKRRPD